MTAKDVISPRENLPALRRVGPDMPLLEVLPRLLDAPGRVLAVGNDGDLAGTIDEISLLEGLGRLIAPRDDSSVLVVECAPHDYSASTIAHAVEDVDAHLVDLISHPSEDGRLHVTLRIRTIDPTRAAMNLERYGYRIIESPRAGDLDNAILAERLASLRALMNV